MRASTYVLVAVAPVNLAVNVFLVHHTRLGLLGSPLAISITFWLSFLALALVTYSSHTHRKNGTWAGFQPGLVFDSRSCAYFLKLAIPGILMVGTEWCVRHRRSPSTVYERHILCRAAFEIVALAAGRLGSLPLAAQSVIMTTDQSMSAHLAPHHVRSTHRSSHQS